MSGPKRSRKASRALRVLILGASPDGPKLGTLRARAQCLAQIRQTLGGKPDRVIAADGGIDLARSLGIEFDAWVGDGDSARRPRGMKPKRGAFTICLRSDKAMSDYGAVLELLGVWTREPVPASRRASTPSLRPMRVVTIGCLGGRRDQEWAVLLESHRALGQVSSVKHAVQAEIESITHWDAHGARVVQFPVHRLRWRETEWRTQTGQEFSLFAIGGTIRLRVVGAEYPGSRAAITLSAGSRGLSNRALRARVALAARALAPGIATSLLLIEADGQWN